MIKKVAPIIFNRLTLNLFFWGLFAYLHYFPKESFSGYFSVLFIVVIMYAPPVYINNLLLMPILLLRQKYFKYAIAFILLFTITSFETNYIHSFLNQKSPNFISFGPMITMGLPLEIFPNLLMFGMFAFGKFLADGLKAERKIEEFNKDKIENELANLKAQINPHFLFNALNTIYGLASRTDKQTAEAVLKLSNILRQSIYSSDKNEISLHDEISLIGQYISFTVLRFYRKDLIKLCISGDVENQKIVPLILTPFIENAIKHGIGTDSSQEAVSVSISINGNVLIFSCSNNKLLKNGQDIINMDGIGLKNVIRRLSLCYPERHKLEIIDDRNKYIVNLKMNLS